MSQSIVGIQAPKQPPVWKSWIPAMIGVAVIACESTNVMGADNTSRWLYPVWVALFGKISMHDWAIIHHILRKTGHFTGYGLVSLGFYRGWSATFSSKWNQLWRIRRRAALFALFCTLVVASSDEYHQSFLPARTSSIYDVGIDISGGITAHALLFACFGISSLQRRRAVPAESHEEAEATPRRAVG